jgi:hypothetical protein
MKWKDGQSCFTSRCFQVDVFRVTITTTQILEAIDEILAPLFAPW